MPSYTCCPIYIIATSINVTGTFPSLKLVNDDNKMNAKPELHDCGRTMPQIIFLIAGSSL